MFEFVKNCELLKRGDIEFHLVTGSCMSETENESHENMTSFSINAVHASKPEQGVGCAAVIMRHSVAHLQTQTEIHLVSHPQGQTHRAH